jgi:hypothetical protein
MDSYGELDKYAVSWKKKLAGSGTRRKKRGAYVRTPLPTRRQVLALIAALIPEFAFAKTRDKNRLSLILPPSNLALRPEENTVVPK